LENSESTEMFSKLDAFYNSLSEEGKKDCAKSMTIVKNLIQKANDSFLTTSEYKELKQKLNDCEANGKHRLFDFDELYRAMREKRKAPVEGNSNIFYYVPPRNEEEKLMDQIYDSNYSFSKLSSIVKNKKKQQILDKIPEVRDIIKNFVETLTPFQEIKKYVDELKSKVKDAKQLKQEKQDALEKKQAEELRTTPKEAIDAQIKVKKQIEDMISGFENDYKTNTMNRLTSKVEKFVQINADKVKDNSISKSELYGIKNDAKPYYDFIDAIIWDDHVAWNGVQVRRQDNYIKLKSDYKTIIEQKTNNSWNSMKEFFIVRMQEKLVPIVKAKASQTNSSNFTLTKKTFQTDYGLIEGKFNLIFADGSYFDVTHQAIFKYSIYNKQFNQFPTRFSNIQMADGTHYNALPAAELYRKFAGIAPPKEES
jgi:hypothetical protein